MMTDSETAIHSLWHLLSQITAFTFQAGNGEGSRTDWNGRAAGQVVVTPWEGGLSFAESGQYTTPHGQRLAMSNRYGWQRGEQGIRLCHLRFGAPVPLFELVPVTARRWQSREPHLCGADHYRAELVLTEQGFDVEWVITGPRKNERIAYCYRI
ncbi:DUF6314 family protein [Aeromonas simiae]|uniref:DUF6314 family protein n=1 Tax=Aeromonas simiae TaxID=218936 RepID=UPI000AFC524C